MKKMSAIFYFSTNTAVYLVVEKFASGIAWPSFKVTIPRGAVGRIVETLWHARKGRSQDSELCQGYVCKHAARHTQCAKIT